MPIERFVFLDFDDTLSDPYRFHTQYVREIGALLAPQYGGDAADWSKGAIDVLQTLEAEYIERFVGNPLNAYCAWLDTVRARSAGLLFERMGMPPPPDSRRVARETQFNALRRCNALFPGCGSALHALANAGHAVHLASGQESEYLTAALVGADLQNLVGSKFGPDLIDCAKEGPEYFERVFAAVGATAADAIVVDDYPPAIRWGMQAGAAVIQSRLSRERHFDEVNGVAGMLFNLTDLPGLVESIFATR